MARVDPSPNNDTQDEASPSSAIRPRAHFATSTRATESKYISRATRTASRNSGTLQPIYKDLNQHKRILERTFAGRDKKTTGLTLRITPDKAVWYVRRREITLR